MPRAEVGTPKWLANKMKAKGLQRLRWYCQMCEKQCRDENGFKCHRMSEVHQRQMQIFMQRPGRYMDEFSREFEASFMRLMRTRYCRARVLANTVYCEVISDKQHVHMNSTIWVTLSDFVLYLGRTGKCKIEHTERGWYIEYIDQEKITREQQERSKRKAEVAAEEYQANLLAEQVKTSWAAAAAAAASKSNRSATDEDSAASLTATDSQTAGSRICFKLPAVRQEELSTREAKDGKAETDNNTLALNSETKSGENSGDDCSSSAPVSRSTSKLVVAETVSGRNLQFLATPSFRDMLLLKAKQTTQKGVESPNTVQTTASQAAAAAVNHVTNKLSNSDPATVVGIGSSKKRPAAIDRLVMELELEKKRQQVPVRRAFGTGV